IMTPDHLDVQAANGTVVAQSANEDNLIDGREMQVTLDQSNSEYRVGTDGSGTSGSAIPLRWPLLTTDVPTKVVLRIAERHEANDVRCTDGVVRPVGDNTPLCSPWDKDGHNVPYPQLQVMLDGVGGSECDIDLSNASLVTSSGALNGINYKEY